MSGRPDSGRLLAARVRASGLDWPASVREPFETYLGVLARWNRRMNLTGLSVDPPDDQAIDRLLVEPLGASLSVPDGRLRWFDLGSGCGSPAIPLKLARPAAELVMVEATARKAAFLREAVRLLGLAGTQVLAQRFEAVAAAGPQPADLVTVRAVRPDATLFGAAAALLKPGGMLLQFGSSGQEPSAAGQDFALQGEPHPLTAASSLTIWRRQ